MTPEWEDIEPWFDERLITQASGLYRRKITQADLDKLWADLSEYMQDSSSRD